MLLASIDLMSDLALRRRAVQALGELGDEQSLDILLKLAGDDGHALQEDAAEAIGHLGKSDRADKVLELLKRFAKRLKTYLPGILSHCRWPLHTSLLEGMNNKIKVIKRMAYGYRDDEYFFLKIRQAFPGIPG